MGSWSNTRRTLYGIVFFGIIAAMIFIPVYYLFIKHEPTCFDKIQNQDEGGIDCGGICSKACPNQIISQPVIEWARTFPVAEGVTNLVAYIQNPNIGYIGSESEYVFNVYDEKNVLIGSRLGKTIIPHQKSFPIFEQTFSTGERTPKYVLFEFTNQNIQWNKYPNLGKEVVVTNKEPEFVDTTPRISGELENLTVYRIKDIAVVVIVYDENGNAAAASRTYVRSIDGQSKAPIVFTWPRPFKFKVSKVELIPILPILGKK
jgi:hypothetical protein